MRFGRCVVVVVASPGAPLSGGLERQPSNLVRAPSWTDPAKVAPPAYGFLGRKPSASVAKEYNVSRETARDMIDKGIVTPHDIDMQVNGANQKSSLSILVSLV